MDDLFPHPEQDRRTGRQPFPGQAHRSSRCREIIHPEPRRADHHAENMILAEARISELRSFKETEMPESLEAGLAVERRGTQAVLALFIAVLPSQLAQMAEEPASARALERTDDRRLGPQDLPRRCKISFEPGAGDAVAPQATDIGIPREEGDGFFIRPGSDQQSVVIEAKHGFEIVGVEYDTPCFREIETQPAIERIGSWIALASYEMDFAAAVNGSVVQSVSRVVDNRNFAVGAAMLEHATQRIIEE